MNRSILNLAGQTAIYGVSSIFGRFLNYLLVPFHTRLFLPDEYGVITEFYAYIAILLVFLTYGMETAFFRFYEKNKNLKSGIFSTGFISLFISTSLFIVFTIIFAKDIAVAFQYPDHHRYVVFIGLIVSLDALSALPFAKLRAQKKAVHFALVKLLNIFLNIGFNLFFYLDFDRWTLRNDLGVEYVFISNLIASSITFVALFPVIFRQKFVFLISLWKQMLWYAFPLLIYGLAGIVNETISRILIKYLLPADIALGQLGIYGACYKVSIFMTIFIQAFRYAAEPFFFSKADDKDAKVLYAEVMKYFIIVTSSIFLVITLFMDLVVKFIDEPYRVGAPVIPILLMANLFLGVFYNLSIWYKLSNKTKYGAYLALIGTIITLVLNFLWIPVFGYYGAAWATFICYGIMMILSYFLGQKHFPVRYNIPKILIYISISAGLFFLHSIVETDNTAINHGFAVLILLFFGAFVYFFEKTSKQKAL